VDLATAVMSSVIVIWADISKNQIKHYTVNNPIHFYYYNNTINHIKTGSIKNSIIEKKIFKNGLILLRK